MTLAPLFSSFLLLNKFQVEFGGRFAFVFAKEWALERGRGGLTGVCILSLGHLQRWKKAWSHWGDWIGWCELEKRPLLGRTLTSPELAVNYWVFPSSCFQSSPSPSSPPSAGLREEWVRRESAWWLMSHWPAFAIPVSSDRGTCRCTQITFGCCLPPCVF